MGDLLGPATGKLRISSKLDSEHPLPAHAPVTTFYTALVTGGLRSLQVLTDRYHQDVNLVSEISKNELEWQVKSQASYGLSGNFPLKARPEKTLKWSTMLSRLLMVPEVLELLGNATLCPNPTHPTPSPTSLSQHACVPPFLAKTAFPSLGNWLRCPNLLLLLLVIHSIPFKAKSHSPSLGIFPLHLSYRQESSWQWDGNGEDAGLEGLDTAPGFANPCCTTLHREIKGRRIFRFLTPEGGNLQPGHSPKPGCLVFCAQTPTCLGRSRGTLNVIYSKNTEQKGIFLMNPAAAFLQPSCRSNLAPQILQNYFPGKLRLDKHEKSCPRRFCAAAPEVIEVLCSSCSQILVSQDWAEAVPEEVFQQHQPFYKSLFRCLQHLCRSTVRKNLGSRRHSLIPLLPVPKALLEYLLLEPKAVVL
ncbi:ASB18 protein, partial [Piprites chloris]|nr:ASB18 protein [Piprites chloris]